MAESATHAANFVIVVTIARILGPSPLGLMAFAFSLAGILALLPNFGLENYVVREVAHDSNKAEWLFKEGIKLKTPLAAIALGVFLVWIWLAGFRSTRAISAVLCAVIVLIEEFQVFGNGFFRAKQRMGYEASLRVAQSFMVCVCAIAVLSLGYGLNALLAVRMAVVFLIMSVTLIVVKVRFVELVGPSTMRISPLSLVRNASPMALFRSLVIAYVGIGVVILGMVKGDEAVGYYSAASKLVVSLQILATSLAGSYLPAMSYAHSKSKTELASLFSSYVSSMMVVSFPFAILVLFWGDGLILLLYGSGFMPSSLILILLAFSLVPDFLNHALNTSLIATGHERTCWKVAALGLGCSFIMNLILVRPFGGVGTAVATLGTECVVFCALWVAATHKIALPVPWRQGIRPILISILALVAAWLIGRDNLLIAVCIFGGIWVGFLLLTINSDISDLARNVKALFTNP